MSITSNAHFAKAPSVSIKRSRFDRSFSYKTTFNNGDIIPIGGFQEILPGDTVTLDLRTVIRMSTPIKPIMDNVIYDTFAFFVPNRLVMADWKRFMGELGQNEHWRQSSETVLPQFDMDEARATNPAVLPYWYRILDADSAQRLIGKLNAGDPGMWIFESSDGGSTWSASAISAPYTYDATKTYGLQFIGVSPDSLAAYMGVPQGFPCFKKVDSSNPQYLEFTQLPFRAYCLIWNEYFRDQNYMDPCDIRFNDNSTCGFVDIHGKKDITTDRKIDLSSWYTNYVTDAVKGAKPLQAARFADYFSTALPQPQRGDATEIPLSGSAPVIDAGGGTQIFRPVVYNSSGTAIVSHPLYTNGSGLSTDLNTTLAGTANAFMSLNADLSNVVSGSTINDLRTAFQVQKWLETSARTGTRYTEVIEGFFGVHNSDRTIQRPELLCWNRKFLHITQVLQTSASDATSPQGNTAAYSLTGDKKSLFTKSFTEHGYLFVLGVSRTTRSYQQGYNRSFSRKRKFDFYWPQFAHLSEQPIFNYEVWAGNYNDGSVSEYNNEVFGYQERNAEYKYQPDLVTGEFSSNSPQPLDFWHFADYSDEPVYMSKEWLFEGPEQLDRCLAVTSDQAHQFQADFYFDALFTRPMPLYSIPGLADHF